MVKSGADQPGALALLVLAAVAGGDDPTAFGGSNLVDRLAATVTVAAAPPASPTASPEPAAGGLPDTGVDARVAVGGLLGALLLLAGAALLGVRPPGAAPGMTTRRVLARPGSRFAGRAGAVALTTALLVAVVVGWAAPASASSYRYWSYWHGTSGGGWTFSQVGAQYQPAAGSVDGWRFAVSGTAGSVKPRAAASFDAICGSHAPAASRAEAGRARRRLRHDCRRAAGPAPAARCRHLLRAGGRARHVGAGARLVRQRAQRLRAGLRRRRLPGERVRRDRPPDARSRPRRGRPRDRRTARPRPRRRRRVVARRCGATSSTHRPARAHRRTGPSGTASTSTSGAVAGPGPGGRRQRWHLRPGVRRDHDAGRCAGRRGAGARGRCRGRCVRARRRRTPPGGDGA